MLRELSAWIDKMKEVLPAHDGDVLDQDLQSIRMDFGRFSVHVQDLQHELHDKLKQWKAYHGLFHQLILWLTAKESLLQDYNLKDSLSDKEHQNKLYRVLCIQALFSFFPYFWN